MNRPSQELFAKFGQLRILELFMDGQKLLPQALNAQDSVDSSK